MSVINPQVSFADEQHVAIEARKPRKFYVVGKSLFSKIIVGWVLTTVVGGMFVNYLSDTYKDRINKVVRNVWHYDAVQMTSRGHALINSAEKLSWDNKHAEAQAAYDEGVALLVEAAAVEIPDAMHYLGRLYCLGRAGYIQPDGAKAKFYLGKAVAAGETNALALLMSGCRRNDPHRP